MTLRIRQVALAARNLEGAVRALGRDFGLQVSFRDPGVELFGLCNAVMPLGDQFLEVVSPSGEGTTAGRLLDRRGDSGYMVILQTDDFARDRERMDRLGVRVVWEVTLDDIRAMHLHPKDIGGPIVSLDQPVPPSAWRWGGPDWERFLPERGALHIEGVEIEARDPEGMARRWAEVLGLEAPTREQASDATAGTWRVTLDGGWVRFVEPGSRGEGLAAVQLTGPGRPEGVHIVCGTRFDWVGGDGQAPGPA